LDSEKSDVMKGDVFEDLDKTRPGRHLRVVDVDDAVGIVRLVNIKTQRMTRVRVDRLKPRSNGSHGYQLIFREEEVSGG
jgi:hypothetical protein